MLNKMIYLIYSIWSSWSWDSMVSRIRFK